MSKMVRRALTLTLGTSALLLAASCSSEPIEQTQIAVVPPTAVATTAPVAMPTAPPPTATPAPTATAVPAAPTSTPAPTPTAAPTAEAPPAPTTEPTSAAAPADDAVAADPTATPTADPAPTPTPTVAVETPTETPTPAETDEVAATPTAEPSPTAEASDASAVATSGEPPLECYDQQVRVYRAYVEGVDDLSFEGGRVFCAGAGTNAVAAAASYRHSTGLVISRNGDFIFNEAGTAYIPYSGSIHFCLNGQPASAPVVAETVPSLLVLIDAEAQRQVAQGATGPAVFTPSGAQC